MYSLRRRLCLALLLVWWPAHLWAAAHTPSEYLIYFGTYTGKQSKGIYTCRFHPHSGKLTPVKLAAETSNPSFLAADPEGRYLFAVNEDHDYQGAKSGSVSSFGIDKGSGELTALNTVASRGTDPCHVAVAADGKHVLIANYSSGSVAVLPVNPEGKLGEACDVVQHSGSSAHPERQRGPHAHEVVLTPDNRRAIVADLGLDKLMVYDFDTAKGSLTAHEPPFARLKSGSGPRHFAFHPNLRFAYAIDELASTVTAFSWSGTLGTLQELQTISTLPSDFKGANLTAEIAVHPSGRYLYASNRGHDSIAVFAIDPAKGTLTFVERVATLGKEPRNFALDPTGGYLFAANQKSDDVVIFRVNPENGRLTPSGNRLAVPSPVCVTFVAAE